MRALRFIKTTSIIMILAACAWAERGTYNAFTAGEISPDLYGRTDAVKFYRGVQLLENMFVWPHGPVEKRPGTYFVAEIVETTVIPEVPEIPAAGGDYAVTYINELATIWGATLGDGTLGSRLVGPAVDAGGGIVSLPTTANPYVEGMVILITGASASYSGLRTLTAGTSATELRFSTGFATETFDGTETVVRFIQGFTAGAGRMDADDGAANLYVGHGYSSNTYVTRVEVDGTLHTDAVTFSTLPAIPAAHQATGIKLSADDSDLYVNVAGRIYRFDLSDGSETWAVVGGGFDMDIDASDNTYAQTGASITTQFATADGAATQYTFMGDWGGGGAGFGSTTYDIHVDDGLGLVMQGGLQQNNAPANPLELYNFSVRTFDDADGDQLQIGGTFTSGGGAVNNTYTIGTGMITSDGSSIYVLVVTGAGRELFKYGWNGSSLTQQANVAGPVAGSGLFIGANGNVVVANGSGATENVLHFYDTDLNLIDVIDPLPNSMLSTWLSGAGNLWRQGNAVFDGAVATDGTPAVPAETVTSALSGGTPPAILLSFAAIVGDGRIIEAGDQYFTFYKDVP
ncbi:MAG: hypothetical protein V3W44_04250 [Dehalococcoidales bacterium]